MVGRYVRISLTHMTTVAEAGRLVIGEVWAPSRDMRYGFEKLCARPEPAQRKPWRHGVRRRSTAAARLSLTILGLTEEEAEEEVDRLNRLAGSGATS